MFMSKARFILMLLILVLAISIPVNNTFAQESNVTVTGKAGLLFQHNFTDKEKDEFLKISNNKIDQYDGWSLEGNKIKRLYPAHTGEVKINGKIIDINLDGTFKANNVPVGTAEIELKIDEYDVITKSIEVTANGEKNIELFIEKDLEEILKTDMDNNNDMEDVNRDNNIELMKEDPGGGGAVGQIDKHGQKGILWWYVHCNRFNGPNGNYTYYSKSSWQLPQAINNFVGSDCDYAAIKYRCTSRSTMSKCHGLKYYKGTLNSNPTNCSTAVGKSTRFHK